MPDWPANRIRFIANADVGLITSRVTVQWHDCYPTGHDRETGRTHYRLERCNLVMSASRSRSRKDENSWLSGRILWIVGGILALIILAPILIGFFDDNGTPEVLQGHVEEMPDEGRDHVPDGTEVEYESDPPTSGPHYARWANAGIHNQDPPPDELLVHNLEHGHVVIYYHPDLISDESVEKITELIDQYDGQWDAVLAVPRPEMDAELTLTAWTYKMELDEYDEELIEAFVDAYRGKGPENPVR